MIALEEKILKEGKVYPGNVLNVGCFLNQQIDIDFLFKMGEEIYRLYKDNNITKILTIEASGIAIAAAAAFYFHVPVVFAKKSVSSNLSNSLYFAEVHSYTKGNTYNACVTKDFLSADDNVLIVDDFLAVGGALKGLMNITSQAGASLAGCAIAIEKGFQGGGDTLRRSGIRVESLAIIESMSDDGNITFRKQ